MKIKQWIVNITLISQIFWIQNIVFPSDIKIYDKNYNKTGEIQQKTKDKYIEYDKNWNVKNYYKIDNGKINVYDNKWNRIKELKEK